MASTVIHKNIGTHSLSHLMQKFSFFLRPVFDDVTEKGQAVCFLMEVTVFINDIEGKTALLPFYYWLLISQPICKIKEV